MPDRPQAYPEPSMFGILPAWALYVRHATGIQMSVVPSTQMPSKAGSVTPMTVNGTLLMMIG